MANPKQNIYADLLLQRLEDHGIKGGKQSVRDRGSGWLPRNGVFWIHQGSCIDELTAVLQDCGKDMCGPKQDHGEGSTVENSTLSQGTMDSQ